MSSDVKAVSPMVEVGIYAGEGSGPRSSPSEELTEDELGIEEYGVRHSVRFRDPGQPSA